MIKKIEALGWFVWPILGIAYAVSFWAGWHLFKYLVKAAVS